MEHRGHIIKSTCHKSHSGNKIKYSVQGGKTRYRKPVRKRFFQQISKKIKNYGINSDSRREDGFTNIQDKVWQYLRRWNFKGSDIFWSEVLEYSRKGRFVKREINR